MAARENPHQREGERAHQDDRQKVRHEQQHAAPGKVGAAGTEEDAGVGQRRHQRDRDGNARQRVGHVLAARREGPGEAGGQRGEQINQSRRGPDHDLVDRCRVQPAEGQRQEETYEYSGEDASGEHGDRRADSSTITGADAERRAHDRNHQRGHDHRADHGGNGVREQAVGGDRRGQHEKCPEADQPLPHLWPVEHQDVANPLHLGTVGRAAMHNLTNAHRDPRRRSGARL